MKIHAVRAGLEHAGALGAVHAAAFQSAYEGLIPPEVLAEYTPEARKKVFEMALATRTEAYYLFYLNGEPVGLAIVSGSHETGAPKAWGEVYAFYTVREIWGTRATHQAFSFCLDRLRAMGFSMARLWVLEGNARAVAFYQKHGFAVDGAEKMLTLGVRLNEIRMTKRL